MAEEEQPDENMIGEGEEEQPEDGEEHNAGFGLDLMHYLLQARFRENADTNAKMVIGLKKRGLLSKHTEKAFLAVPRGDFLLPDMTQEAYQDTPLRFAALGFNISAPHMYATCFEELQVEEGNTFLDIGSGCGHMTCLAGFTVGPRGKVIGLDIRQDIVEFAEANKKKFEERTKLDLSNTTFEMRNCFIADPEGRLYDRIHVGACCPKYKLDYLQTLLAPGGVMVTPHADQLIKVIKDPVSLEITTKTLAAVRYGDLIVPSDAEMRQAEIAAQRYRAKRVLIPDDHLIHDFADMANNEKYHDVIFKVQNKTVYAHKFMLSLRCPYLHTLVQSVNTTATNNHVTTEVNFSEIRYDTFISILKYIYCGELLIKQNNVAELYEAATELSLSNLSQTCGSYLKNLKEEPKTIVAPILLKEPLQDILANLVNNEKLSDVVFIVEDDKNSTGAESPHKKQKTGSQVYGHRFIMALRSEYFRSIFMTGMREAMQSEIAIPEVKKESFLSILRFVYTGDKAVVNEDNVIDLLEAANYFSETRLKCLCEDVLKRGIETENAAYILDVATRYEADQLRNFCVEYILTNFDEVSKTKTFEDLDRELVVSLTLDAVKRLRICGWTSM